MGAKGQIRISMVFNPSTMEMQIVTTPEGGATCTQGIGGNSVSDPEFGINKALLEKLKNIKIDGMEGFNPFEDMDIDPTSEGRMEFINARPTPRATRPLTPNELRDKPAMAKPGAQKMTPKAIGFDV